MEFIHTLQVQKQPHPNIQLIDASEFAPRQLSCKPLLNKTKNKPNNPVQSVQATVRRKDILILLLYLGHRNKKTLIV